MSNPYLHDISGFWAGSPMRSVVAYIQALRFEEKLPKPEIMIMQEELFWKADKAGLITWAGQGPMFGKDVFVETE